MSLDAVISEYFLAETALRRSLKKDLPGLIRANHLRVAADALEAVERYEPRSSLELRDKVYFFMARAITRPDFSIDGRDLNLVLTLTGHPDVCIRTAEANGQTQSGRRPGTAGQDLIQFVTGARERVSLFDNNVHYIATSKGNAAFYNTRPVRMIGLHLRQIIGDTIFEDLAAPMFDAARSGEPQEYYYDISTDNGPLRWRSEIKPVDLGNGIRGFLVFQRNVTDEVDLKDERLIAGKAGANTP